MNFYDFAFIFIFVPLVWLGARLVRLRSQAAQYLWLIAASLIFYSTWQSGAVGVLIGSVAGNYGLGRLLSRTGGRSWLIAGVGANLAVLAYFKYSLFFTANLVWLVDLTPYARVTLPLGISFFTFQQISYLVDSWRAKTPPHSFLSYVLFITFFPHLVAGPIVLQGDVLRQLERRRALLQGPRHLALGLGLFAIGLAKKILVADSFSVFASALFGKAAAAPLSTAEAWQAAVAYGFQIYFDFSGYSDMAIGLAYMLGLRLPFNFNSPYRSLDIADFWRRWHMSLSRFLKHYLYFSLGGNRKGAVRTLINLMIVMILGGLWHGAAWTFVLWGAVHGTLLVVHHGWRRLGFRMPDGLVGRTASWALTFVAVMAAWIPFRAADVQTSFALWRSMAGFGSLGLGHWPLSFLVLAGAAMAICLALPNSQRIVFAPAPLTLPWAAPVRWKALVAGGLAVAALAAEWQMHTPPDFIYFNF